MMPALAAYLAGIVDGEGHIQIAKDKRHHSYNPRVVIGNTSWMLIDWLCKNVGGRIHAVSPKKPNDKPSWLWWVSGFEAMRVLRIVEPYLVAKKEHASLVLSVQRFGNPMPGRRWTGDEKLQGASAYAVLQKLNHRGRN